MDPGGPEGNDEVALLALVAGDDPVLRHVAEAGSGEVHAVDDLREDGDLPADYLHVGELRTLLEALADLLRDLRVGLVDGDVVHEGRGFGVDADGVVDVHRYAVDADEKDSIELTIEMIERTKLASCPAWIDENPLIITMAEAMYMYAGVDMDKAENISYLRKEAERLSLTPAPDEPWDDTFNRIFLTYTEPSLPKDREVYLTEYPERIRCLAAKDSSRPVRKRWEMYIDGIEVANCYAEETDKGEMASYFAEEEARLIKEREGSGDAIPPADPAFPSLDIPESSGTAMGLDRLLAAEMGLKTIEPLLLFPLSDMLTDGKSRI